VNVLFQILLVKKGKIVLKMPYLFYLLDFLPADV